MSGATEDELRTILSAIRELEVDIAKSWEQTRVYIKQLVDALRKVTHEGGGVTGPHGTPFEECQQPACRVARVAIGEIE